MSDADGVRLAIPTQAAASTGASPSSNEHWSGVGHALSVSAGASGDSSASGAVARVLRARMRRCDGADQVCSLVHPARRFVINDDGSSLGTNASALPTTVRTSRCQSSPQSTNR